MTFHNPIISTPINFPTLITLTSRAPRVLILAVHSCARRRQMAAEEKRARDQPKDDHHVTKINREEEW